MQSSGDYLILPRKYRPLDFTDLQGQEVIVQTLTYAIIKQRLASAYLFTGSHGIGKTTIARLLAKIVNCTKQIITKNEVKACNKCPNCLLIQNNTHPDLLEIDAASHTGVEDIRIITDNISYKPLQGKYRIFIIDEVHMLSKNAFNALLKTLEEPPSQVIFIFATTEVNKLPATIISRCQRFDLRRFNAIELYELLVKVCRSEQITYEDEALKLLANCAEGAARDALSLLDQAYTFALAQESVISTQLVEKLLNRASQQTIITLFQLVLEGDTEQMLTLIAKLYAVNTDFVLLCHSILELINYLSKLKVVKDYSLPSFSEYQYQLQAQLKLLTLARLTHLWQIFSTGIAEIKSAFDPLLIIEMLFIKAMYLTTLPSPYQLAQTLVDNTAKVAAASIVIPNSPTITTKPPTQLNSDGGEAISNLLTFIYKQRELDLYYYLMNQVEIKQLDKEQLVIKGEPLTITTKTQLHKLLNLWSKNAAYIITHQPSTNFVSFKQKLATEFTNSEAYHKIITAFQEAKITSITLDLNEK